MEDMTEMLTITARTPRELDDRCNAILKGRGWLIVSSGHMSHPWDGKSWWATLGKMAVFV